MIRDTGIAAAQVLAAAAEGLSREQILQRYSALTEEDVATVFEAAALAFHGEPDLVLPPLPLRLDISGSAATGGLVVNVAAEVDGSDVILTARDLLESDDGIRVGHRHWRLARNDARILRLLVDRGRQDGRGRLLIRPEITPEVLPVLRRRPNTREDEAAAAITVEHETPLCILSAEPAGGGSIRVTWRFTYADGTPVPGPILSDADSAHWLRDGNRYVPAPALPEDRPRWLEPRNSHATLRGRSALRFLRDELPILREAPGIRVEGDAAHWRLIDEPWRSRLSVTLVDRKLRVVPSFAVGESVLPVEAIKAGERVVQGFVGVEWFAQPSHVDSTLKAWEEAGLDLTGATDFDDPEDIAALIREDAAPLRELADELDRTEELARVNVVEDPTRVIVQADTTDNQELSLVVGFAAREHIASWHELADGTLDGHRWRGDDLVRFESRAPERAAQRLDELGAEMKGDRLVVRRDRAARDPIENDFQALREIGHVIVSQRLARLADLQSIPAVPTINISLGADGLLWLSPRYDVGGKEFPLDAVREGRDGMELFVDGTRVEVAEGPLQAVRRAVKELGAREEHGRFVLPMGRYGELMGLLENVATVEYAEDFRRLLDALRDFSGIDTQAPPPGLETTLFPYQQRGYDWLCFLRHYGLHGILADDMGLGKTVQTIGLILAVAQHAPLARVLVVSPRSVMPNWERDIRRFAPSVDVAQHHGVGRLQAARWYDKLQQPLVLLTTYGCLVRDVELLARTHWDVLVVDEAQTIKNFATKSARSAKSLPAHMRLALSGTPIENRLGDLWALFDFVMPGYLGSYRSFRRRYEAPITLGAQAEQERMELMKRIRPFVLRRRKRDVAPELPDKIEVPRYCELTNEQVTLYRDVLATQGRTAVEEVRKRGAATMHALAAITKLKQICCHPALIAGDTNRLRRRSGKFEAFIQLVEEIQETGEKTLVFSQFVKMIDLLRHVLEECGRRVYVLTGATSKRQALIDRFKADTEPAIFLISLRAGGVGLNLQEATNVVHYDRWWNPMVEAQATDRAHRIGQTQPVEVFRLDTIGTIEEKIDLLQRKKCELFSQVVDGDTDAAKALTAEELISLFEFDQEEGADLDDDEG